MTCTTARNHGTRIRDGYVRHSSNLGVSWADEHGRVVATARKTPHGLVVRVPGHQWPASASHLSIRLADAQGRPRPEGVTTPCVLCRTLKEADALVLDAISGREGKS